MIGMPSSAPSTVYRAVVDGVEKIGSFFFMYPYNRLIVRRSWHLSRMETSLVPKHGDQVDEGGRYPLRNKGKGRTSGSSSSASNQEPVHGDNLHYEEAIQMPNKYMAFLVSFSTFSFFAMFFLSSLVRPCRSSRITTDTIVPMGYQQGHPSTRRRCFQGVSSCIRDIGQADRTES
jgi:hypothetical protein